LAQYLTKAEHKRIVRRWTIALSDVLLLYLFGERLGVRFQQLAWHIFHANQLKLTYNEYHVPLRWKVESLDTNLAVLVDLPMTARSFASFTISDGPPVYLRPRPEHYNAAMLLAQGRFANGGTFERAHRLKSGSEDLTCFEGTRRIFPLSIFVIECHGASGRSSVFTGDRARADAYYAILSSARPL
jgi:hypothetical protein